MNNTSPKLYNMSFMCENMCGNRGVEKGAINSESGESEVYIGSLCERVREKVGMIVLGPLVERAMNKAMAEGLKRGAYSESCTERVLAKVLAPMIIRSMEKAMAAPCTKKEPR